MYKEDLTFNYLPCLIPIKPNQAKLNKQRVSNAGTLGNAEW